MSINHPAVAALPIAGSANKTLLRNLVTASMPFVLPDTANFTNIVAVDPDTGAIPIDTNFLGRIFHYDPADSTTAHDGTSCLVSADGLRYKLAVGTDVFAYAVLDNTHTAPPASPTLGDKYLVAAAATGAWAGKSNYIAAYTRRGWEFLNFDIGRFIYVEAVDTYYHKNAGGSWVTGLGSQTAGANSIPLSAAINFGKRLIVENQTTTAPPGSPTVGTAYIIGPSATGAWSGLDGKIAICEVAGSFVIYTPTNGWAAYDKSTNNSYTFTGSAWVSSAGAVVGYNRVFTALSIPVTSAVGGSGFYGYNSVTGPGAEIYDSEPATITYTAKAASARLDFTYQAQMLFTSGSYYVIGLARDSVVACIDWVRVYSAGASTEFTNQLINFQATAPDTSSHTYSIRFYRRSTSDGAVQIARRLLKLEEIAS